MMMVSANDAAVAIAEKIGGGSLDGYVRIADATAERLQLADQPVFNDPAGLDDEFANKGGARISPRDLAIVEPRRAGPTRSRQRHQHAALRVHRRRRHRPHAQQPRPVPRPLSGRERVEDRDDRARRPHVRRFGDARRSHDAGDRVRRGRLLRLRRRAARPGVQHAGRGRRRTSTTCRRVVADASLPPPPARRLDSAARRPGAPELLRPPTAVRARRRSFAQLARRWRWSCSSSVVAGLVALRRRTVVRRRRAPCRGSTPCRAGAARPRRRPRRDGSSASASRRSSAGSCLSMWPMRPL